MALYTIVIKQLGPPTFKILLVYLLRSLYTFYHFAYSSVLVCQPMTRADANQAPVALGLVQLPVSLITIKQVSRSFDNDEYCVVNNAILTLGF